MDSYSVFLECASNVPDWGFQIIVSIIIKLDHSPQKFQKTCNVTRYFQNVFQTSRLGFTNQGLILSIFFYIFTQSVSSTFYSKSSCLIIPNNNFKKHRMLLGFFCTCFKRPGLGLLIHSVTSKFYSKSSSLIILHKNFEKHGQLLGFFRMCFERPRLGFPNYRFDFKHFFTFLYTPFLRNSILNNQASSFRTKISKNIDSYSIFLARASNFPDQGFNFKHSFTVLYTPFL